MEESSGNYAEKKVNLKRLRNVVFYLHNIWNDKFLEMEDKVRVASSWGCGWGWGEVSGVIKGQEGPYGN